MSISVRYSSLNAYCLIFSLFGLIGCAGIDRFGERSMRSTSPLPAVTLPTNGASHSEITEMPLEDIARKTDNQGPVTAEITSNQKDTLTVALLLPLSAQGKVGELALAMKNAAEMAQAEYKGSKVKLIVKDDSGNADGARAAVRAAQTEGAQIFLGPLLSSSVQAAATMTRPSGKTMIGFSTDQSVAGRGVYLLSFQPDNDVDQMLAYVSSKGKKSIAALIPEGTYGNVILAAFQESASRRGLKIATIERYQSNTIDNATRAIAALTVPVDALFIPENGDMAAALGNALISNGIDRKRWQLVGTSAWDDPRILKEPFFQTGWFSGPDQTGFKTFAKRYQTRFGNDPPRLASLSYDAVFLVNALFLQYGTQAFTEATLQNQDGMIGTDGLFRFRNNGGIQRMLAIYEITNGSIKILQDPQTRF